MEEEIVETTKTERIEKKFLVDKFYALMKRAEEVLNQIPEDKNI